MPIDVQPELLIHRPREQVAAFMFDPRNDATWTTGVIECRPREPGRQRAGATVERVVRFLGRTFGYQYEVVDAQGDDFVELRVEQPFPMLVRYQLRDAPGGGTLASIRARGDSSSFYRLASRLMAPMVKRQIGKDLALLKKVVEATARAP
jgi:polyketide cyclase/dehydrase/lipid transport protein